MRRDSDDGELSLNGLVKLSNGLLKLPRSSYGA